MRLPSTTLILAAASLVAASSSDDVTSCSKFEEFESCVVPAANDGLACTTDACTCDAYHRTISCYATYCPDTKSSTRKNRIS
ncbi:hypothetical protein O988_08833 [Pseudogymnoascus sp. VKM F-3808]|nr:hypothetical protein O988_08833 [Pseudogymnoascus sp. VKM F-3808]